jgi:hypothetical protein
MRLMRNIASIHPQYQLDHLFNHRGVALACIYRTCVRACNRNFDPALCAAGSTTSDDRHANYIVPGPQHLLMLRTVLHILRGSSVKTLQLDE